MNLMFQSMEDCRILNHIRNDDPYGGYTDEWYDGMRFKAAIAKNSSPEQQIAEKEGITEAFTVVVPIDVNLDYHDVFRRISDGSIFRVTSRTTDSTANKASTVKIAVVTAERWVLPS